MKVQNVEVPCARADFCQHREMGGHIPRQFLVEPQGDLAAADERGISLAVAAGKKRHIVTARNERVGEMSHDPLSAAVELGGNSLVKRGDLGNSH